MHLAVCVEGQTEEEFIKVVLAARLRALGIAPDPILIGSGRERGGGSVTIKQLTADMARLYHTHDAVTSLVDFYGFQRRGGRTVDVLEAHLRGEIGKVVGDGWDEQRVLPYVQMHEFEGLLFSDVSAFASLSEATTESVDALQAIRTQFPSPEQINDNSDTAPSKRIAGVVPKYNKRVDGPLLAEIIGMDTIRAECPRFNAWITRLEALNPDADLAPE